MEIIEKFRKAWKIAPKGSRALILKYGLSNQNAADIFKKGRKEEDVIIQYLQAIKRASAEIAQVINKQNDKVQKL